MTIEEKYMILLNYVKSIADMYEFCDDIACQECRDTIVSASILVDNIGE